MVRLRFYFSLNFALIQFSDFTFFNRRVARYLIVNAASAKFSGQYLTYTAYGIRRQGSRLDNELYR
ncbi:MAG: hypothetical protein ACI80S_000920 [Pseudohongiellaceae bacterium]|jgi:hypothetical protein